MYDEITEFRPVMDQPIGKGALFALGFGLSGGLSKFIARMTGLGPQYGAILLALLAKIKYVEDAVGEPMSELLSTAAWVSAINDITGLQEMVDYGVVKATGSETMLQQAGDVASSVSGGILDYVGLGQVDQPSAPAIRGGGLSPYAMKLAAIR